ncbi:MAG: hypothetical protein KatS3mg020_0695 [Fimbriimonadales bacterium]|nr:MAG: hypothetical protein KatS3mg020_0695 [Fimbriimonadales bacterium]
MYQPNRLLTNPVNKYIIELTKNWEAYELLLRPARRFLFHNLYRPSAYVPEFNKPCFGVLCLRDDREKRPLLVIETDAQLSEALRQSYRECEVMWLEVFEGPAGIHLDCENVGVRMELTCPVAQLGVALRAPLSFVQERVDRHYIPQGRLIQSFHERLLRESLDILVAQYPIECHHQMPFGFVTGYRAQMPPQIARSAVDVVLLVSSRVNADGVVLLPINLNLHNAHVSNEQTSERDRLMCDFARGIEMPFLTIRAAEQPDAYVFSAPTLQEKAITVVGRAPIDWADAIRPFVEAALEALK